MEKYGPILNRSKTIIAYRDTDSSVTIMDLKSGKQKFIKIKNYQHFISLKFSEDSRCLAFRSLLLMPNKEQSKNGKASVRIWKWQYPKPFYAKDVDSFFIETSYNIKLQTIEKSDTCAWESLDYNSFLLLRNSKLLLQLKRKFKYSQLTQALSVLHQQVFGSVSCLEIKIKNVDRPIKYFVSKPNGFDKSRKYPVILTLQNPELRQSNLQLQNQIISNETLFFTSQFCSRGYITVEIPSVIKKGKAAQTMLETVISILKDLKANKWVDSDHMAICGQGITAYYVNYIITQTNVFAAAVSSSGQTDLVSHYGSLSAKGENIQAYYDAADGLFGKTLWEDSAAYISQSPVMLADQIKTPLLLIHNPNDLITPLGQLVELYVGLKRLGQKCWLIKNENENRILSKHEYWRLRTTKVLDFFDTYLKSTGCAECFQINDPRIKL